MGASCAQQAGKRRRPQPGLDVVAAHPARHPAALETPIHITTSTYLTEQEAADYTRFASKSLRNMRTLGTGPAYLRVGRSIRYTRSALDRWMTSREQVSA